MCIAKASTLLTRNTALNVLVLGRKCEIVRKYSKECLFFCSGKSGAHWFTIFISFAFISKGCLASFVTTTLPQTTIEDPIESLQIALKFSKVVSNTICTLLKKDPSFTSINPNVLESRTVFTQPDTSTSLSE